MRKRLQRPRLTRDIKARNAQRFHQLEVEAFMSFATAINSRLAMTGFVKQMVADMLRLQVRSAVSGVLSNVGRVDTIPEIR